MSNPLENIFSGVADPTHKRLENIFKGKKSPGQPTVSEI